MKLAGLQGAFDKGVTPEFSTNQWFKGQYQQQADHYLKYNTAFNGELVRLRNQLDYSVFGNINTVLTLGKEKYIFDPNYIAAINGTDLLTDSIKDEKVIAIEGTVALLDSLHVPVYVCFAPNKAGYYSEMLPEPLTLPGKTNKAIFDSLLRQHQIPVIDFNNWFLLMKDTSAYPLVPKYGAHWTTYGAFLAADTLLAANGCDSIVTTNLTVIVGLEESAPGRQEIRISPNPFNTSFTIHHSETERPLSIRLFNATGMLILSDKITSRNTTVTPKNSLPNGIYFLEISNGIKRTVKRLVKM